MLKNATRKKIGSIATVLVAMSATFVLNAGTAHAGAYGCAGSQIEASNVTKNGSVYGTLRLYWDSTSGKNCAVMVKNNNLIPGTRYIDVSVSNRSTGAKVQDFGNYTWYAGPVSIDGRNACVSANGYIDGYGAASTGYHCG